MSNTATIPALVLTRTYPVSKERVYEAWTTPAIAELFMGPGDHVAKNIKMDVRVGGTFEITMQHAAGEHEDFVGYGTYKEVIPNQRLSMTWSWREDDPKDEFLSVLSLDFKDVAGGCELTLTHEGLPSLDSRERHAEGWNQILDALTQRVK